MIILHEGLEQEAANVRETVKNALGIESLVIRANLDKFFNPIQEFNGYWSKPTEIVYCVIKVFEDSFMILTPRDIYSDNKSRDDNWVFGHDEAENNLIVVSVARMKRHDSEPSDEVKVPLDLYLKRVSFTAIHEIGHSIVNSDHYKEAIWVNERNGHKLELGKHCTNNSCVMYKIVDIKAPNSNEGYMLLGSEKKFDTGMDELLERLNPNWFCDLCRANLSIDKLYR